jgi:hypothetical protein
MHSEIKFKLTGTSPLIMHSGQTSDPLNAFSKALKKISSKRGKTEADLEEMARLEFQASLYVGEDGKVCLPAIVMDAVLLSGAKKFKLGNDFKSGVMVLSDAPLIFEDSKTPVEKLYEKKQYIFRVAVKVGTAKVMRVRPIFKKWSTELSVAFDADIVDRDSVVKAVVRAGEVVGVGDWRPRYGRFSVEVID